MRVLLVVALVAFVSPAHAQPAWAKLTPAEIAAKVEATYKDAASVTAAFAKTQVNATFGTTTVTNGTVSFQRPGKMAWQFIDKKIAGGAVRSRETTVTPAGGVYGPPSW